MPEGSTEVRCSLGRASAEGERPRSHSSAVTSRGKLIKLRQIAGLLVGFMLLVAAAQAQTSVRIRGTITGIDGNVLAVKSRDGQDLKIELAENVAVAVAKKVSFAVRNRDRSTNISRRTCAPQ